MIAYALATPTAGAVLIYPGINAPLSFLYDPVAVVNMALTCETRERLAPIPLGSGISIGHSQPDIQFGPLHRTAAEMQAN
ncbi:hypothetical protein [Sinorhizobium medicae]|uniref:hypothetical protein n=1 Tax=Sinorhizobium medicae TaxID=110321 RepID=UPI00129671E7|nr:hypothetical protein [Sinorhizobium medicae]MDX0931802.1 hypothetical protein [Sinorhizobium medicae]MDX0968016.1 hypothetical protein [Sinorhizobium medicae]MQV45361.1 hypothetical protein [Sinorhizobium medicae]MQV53162.1 hypothetical protein [Sinorhizobium medicae]MQV74523.1 hypothetical protein [Sinorhizobium medicae]